MGRGINLIPASRQARRRERRRVGHGLTATAVYLTLLLAATTSYLALNPPRPADAAAAELAIDSERVALLQGQVAMLQQTIIEADRQIAGGRVLSERPDWSTLLRLVSLAAGEDILLRDFAIETTAPTIEAGATVVVGGIAADPWTVSSFALRLEEAQVFDLVEIESSQREPFGQRTATAFTVRCLLNPTTPGIPETPQAPGNPGGNP